MELAQCGPAGLHTFCQVDVSDHSAAGDVSMAGDVVLPVCFSESRVRASDDRGEAATRMRQTGAAGSDKHRLIVCLGGK